MLYVVTKNSRLTWHVGEEKPHINANEIEEIQADGHELTYAILLFTRESGSVTIPWAPNKRVMRWFGDVAKTIFWAL